MKINREKIRKSLLTGEYRTSPYTTFKIYEPKERIIFKLPFNPDRIVHHAILNVLEPIWRKLFIHNTYACIKGRGIHKCLRDVVRDLKADEAGTEYCLKLDVHKFYPSINHDILKTIIRKKLKDRRVLELLDGIIDSADGVPIGNYLSQFFANLYLTYFDHWVKEVLKIKYYYRYADDIVILSSDKDQLWDWFCKMKEYLEKNLKLEFKPNWQVFPVEVRGIDFVGYVIRHKYVLVRKSIKQRIFKLIRARLEKKMSERKFKRSLQSYFGWLKHCDSKNLLTKIGDLTNIRFNNWRGKLVNITAFHGKYIYVQDIDCFDKYFIIYYIYEGKPYKSKTNDRRLAL